MTPLMEETLKVSRDLAKVWRVLPDAHNAAKEVEGFSKLRVEAIPSLERTRERRRSGRQPRWTQFTERLNLLVAGTKTK